MTYNALRREGKRNMQKCIWRTAAVVVLAALAGAVWADFAVDFRANVDGVIVTGAYDDGVSQCGPFIAAHPGKTVLVVSHVTPIKLLLTLALDAPLSSVFQIFLDTASICIVDYYANGTRSVRLVNDTSHLAGI